MDHRKIELIAPNWKVVGYVHAADFDRIDRNTPVVWVSADGKCDGVRLPASHFYREGHEHYGDDLFLPDGYTGLLDLADPDEPLSLRARLVPRRAHGTDAPAVPPATGAAEAVARLDRDFRTLKTNHRNSTERIARLERRIETLTTGG